MSHYLVDRLIEARKSGRRIATLAEEHVPADNAAAAALQDEIGEKLGMRFGGWKVGSAAPDAPPICARIFVADIIQSPGVILAPHGGFNSIEGEIVVKIGHDLPLRSKPYSVDEAWEAVASLHPAVEYLESRFVNMRAISPIALLADGFGNGGLVVGPAAPEWRTFNLDKPESWSFVDGEEKSHRIAGCPVGNPKPLIAWLANHSAQRGCPLRAGEVITTGSHTGVVFVPMDKTVVVRFAGLGEASLTLASRCNP